MSTNVQFTNKKINVSTFLKNMIDNFNNSKIEDPKALRMTKDTRDYYINKMNKHIEAIELLMKNTIHNLAFKERIECVLYGINCKKDSQQDVKHFEERVTDFIHEEGIERYFTHNGKIITDKSYIESISDINYDNDMIIINVLFYILFYGYFYFMRGRKQEIRKLIHFVTSLEENAAARIIDFVSTINNLEKHRDKNDEKIYILETYSYVLDHFIKKQYRYIVGNKNYKYTDLKDAFQYESYNLNRNPSIWVFKSISNTHVKEILKAFLDENESGDDNFDLDTAYETGEKRQITEGVKDPDYYSNYSKRTRMGGKKRNKNVKINDTKPKPKTEGSKTKPKNVTKPKIKTEDSKPKPKNDTNPKSKKINTSKKNNENVCTIS